MNTTNVYTHLLSFKRFTVRKIADTPENDKFAYWFPCFLNKEEHAKSLHIARRSLSLMLYGSADHFKPEMALEVFLPAIYNKISAIANSKQLPHFNLYQEITNLQVVVEIFIRAYPELISVLENKLKTFMEDPKSRSVREMEDVNLVWVWALFLPSVSSISDILDVAYDEILQRQAMKILKRIPDLKKSEREDMDISDKQLFDTFEIVKEEFLRLLIFSNFVDNFKKHYESNTQFLDTMEARLHKMEDAIGFSLINNIKLTKSGVNDWNMFFLRIGYAQKSAKDLLNIFLDLKERTKERPGYSEKHLTTIENFKLDSEQVKEWIDSQKNLDLLSFVEGNALKSLTQEQWRDLCFKRWSFLRDYYYAGSMNKQSPADLAKYYEHLTYVRDTQFNDKFSIEKNYLTHISDDKVFDGGFKYAPYSCKTSAEDYH